MTPKLQIRMLTLILGGFLAISLLGAVSSQLFDPGQALAAGQTIKRSGEVRPAEGAAIYLPLVTKWHDPLYISPFGIVMYGDVDDAAGLQRMKDAGSKWATTTLHWSVIEPTRGNYDWSYFDTKAQNAQAAGLDLFVLFTGNPSWAASLPGGPVYDIQNLVNFVTLMAERYDCDGAGDAPGSPCVHDWSFYAEPDNGDINRAREGKGYWGHNGAGYASMLSRVSPAIHQANPQARVLIGGIAYDYFEPGGPFVRSFLGDTLAALNQYPGRARKYIDAVAFHYYPINAADWTNVREKGLSVRSIMQAYGVGDLPLICPEMGFWSSEAGSLPSSETTQARRLVQMYSRGLSIGLEHMSWYKVFDDTSDEFGLFWGQDLNNPKQSYYAYQTLTRELDKAAYLREFQAANVEGYVFQMPGGSEKTVLWATTTSSSASFAGACIDTVHVLGYSQTINDGGTGDADGRVNGQVLLQLARDTPVYVELCR